MESFDQILRDIEDPETGLSQMTRADKIFLLGFFVIICPDPFIPLLVGLLVLFLAWGAVSGRTRSKQPTVRRSS